LQDLQRFAAPQRRSVDSPYFALTFAGYTGLNGLGGIAGKVMKRSKVAMCSIALALFAMPASADASTGAFWQCAPFARMFSGVQLFGAAASWWSQAVGKYSRGETPKEGAVLVFKAIGSMHSGHVATVSQVLSDRMIKVTHANWSARGQVEHDVLVMDTSAHNDWSQVRVWFKNLHDLGTHSYPVYGFIYGSKAAAAAKADADTNATTDMDATPSKS
jgi:surface antigen